MNIKIISLIAGIFVIVLINISCGEDKINIGIGDFDLSKADPSEKQVPDATINVLKKMGLVNIIDLRDRSTPNQVFIKYLINGAVFKQKDKNYITLRYVYIERGSSIGAARIEYKTKKDVPSEIEKKLKFIEEDISAKIKNTEKVLALKQNEQAQKKVYSLAVTGFVNEDFPVSRFPLKVKDAKNVKIEKASVFEIKILDDLLRREIKEIPAFTVQNKEDTTDKIAAQKIKPKGPAEVGKICGVSKVLRVLISKRTYEALKELNSDYYLKIEVIDVATNTVVESRETNTNNCDIVEDFIKLIRQNIK